MSAAAVICDRFLLLASLLLRTALYFCAHLRNAQNKEKKDETDLRSQSRELADPKVVLIEEKDPWQFQ